MQNNLKIYRLEGEIQHYDWGGFHFIPSLLNKKNTGNLPFAEYWMGAHENAPSKIFLPNGEKIKLDEFINKNPFDILGPQVSKQFGRLPYLLKVLDVRNMLSIQVHPSKKNAEEEFDSENNRGIPRDAKNRNYKDNNHKPELMVALGDFWLLHGFKPREQMEKVLQRIPELKFLFPIFKKGGNEGLYRFTMQLDQQEVNRSLQPLVDRIIPGYDRGEMIKGEEDFWAARAAKIFNGNGKVDRGIFSIYFFNLLHLRNGYGIFQQAGIPHAYLEGQNIEIMANSDNVLRGGLTSKHIDVDQLMKHVSFESVDAQPLKPAALNFTGEMLYRTTVSDFQLNVFELTAMEKITMECITAEIFFVYSGSVLVNTGSEELELTKGDAMLGVYGATIIFEAKEAAELFRATVPFPDCK